MLLGQLFKNKIFVSCARDYMRLHQLPSNEALRSLRPARQAYVEMH